MRKRIVLEEKKSITEYYRDYGAGNCALVTTREWKNEDAPGVSLPGVVRRDVSQARAAA